MLTQDYKLNSGTLVFAILTAMFHILFFVAESLLWLEPYIYQSFLSSSEASIGLFEQAKLMETIFFNQGFYNLFLALGLVAGIFFAKRGDGVRGTTLISFCCLFAFGAGIVLALSAGALLGAAVQSFPPMIALVFLYVAHLKHNQTI
ncbi:hypothetical protein MNBD_GAMMA03-490 [hydrothermal vent metagenome]|uniref:DUF1304 domain-containing protein n=1 Tax=hydrothermal vent metagenome TaxID=652676 RepID=A0A3B0W921_9ZZZZ